MFESFIITLVSVFIGAVIGNIVGAFIVRKMDERRQNKTEAEEKN